MRGKALLLVMKNHPGNAAIIGMVCNALTNIALNGDAHDVIVKAGVIPVRFVTITWFYPLPLLR